jgi:hypothetical protein
MDELHTIPNCDYRLHVKVLGTHDCIAGYQVLVEEPLRASNPNVIEFHYCDNYAQLRWTKQVLLNKYTDMHKDKYTSKLKFTRFTSHPTETEKSQDDDD